MLVTKLKGFQEPEPFLKNLQEQLARIAEGAMIMGVSPELKMSYPDFYTKSFKDKDTKKKSVWPKDSVVGQYLEGNDLMDEVVFSVYSRFGGNEEVNSNAVALQDQLNQQFGREDVQNVMMRILAKDYRKIEKEGTIEDFNNWTPRVEMLLREKSEKVIGFYQLRFYKKNAMWSEYTDKVDSMLANKEASNSFMNSQCWDIYKKVDHKKTVKKAIKWMEVVAEKEPNYMYVDTYAALLFKGGKNAAAAKQAELAIKLGNEAGEDVKETEKLLKKIKKAKS
jgi:hypothetical protein